MQARQACRVDAIICAKNSFAARGRDAVEWRPKRGQKRSFCEVKKLINFIPILHARYEGSSDRGGALKPPPMSLGSPRKLNWVLVDTNKTRFDRALLAPRTSCVSARLISLRNEAGSSTLPAHVIDIENPSGVHVHLNNAPPRGLHLKSAESPWSHQPPFGDVPLRVN